MAGSVLGSNAFLKVSPAELTAKAQQVQGKITAMNDTMSQMANSFTTISDNWQSTSGDTYKEKAEILIQEIKESLDNLSFYVSDLNSAGEKYENLENEIQSNVSSLDDPSSIFNV